MANRDWWTSDRDRYGDRYRDEDRYRDRDRDPGRARDIWPDRGPPAWDEGERGYRGAGERGDWSTRERLPWSDGERNYRGERGAWDRGERSGGWGGERVHGGGGERGSWEEGPHRGRGPKGYSRSDERIREDVCDRLADDPHVDASDIEVAVSGGEVTLSGTVKSRFERRHAEDLAESVSGARHVQNNLRVGDQRTWTGAATAGTAAATTIAAATADRGGPERPPLVRTKGSPNDFVTGATTPDAAETDKGDVPGPGLGSV